MSERSSDTCILQIYPLIVTEEILSIYFLVIYLQLHNVNMLLLLSIIIYDAAVILHQTIF